MAIAIGGIPIVIAGIYFAFRNGEITRLIKKPSFYIVWVVILLVIIPVIPLILRIISTSGIQAIDTVQRDGRALLTNRLTIPLYSPNRIFQYSIVLTGLSCALLIPVYLLIRIMKVKICYEEKFSHPLFYFSSFGLLFLIMTYTYCIVRLDNGNNFSRAQGPIAIVSCMCIIAILKYSYNILLSKEKLYILIIIFSLLLPFCWNSVSFRYINKIQVPKNYVLISHKDREIIPRLGNGFIDLKKLILLKNYYNFLEKYNLWSYNFTANDYLTNYILNTKAPGAAGLAVAQGYELSKLYYNSFKNEPFISTGNLNPYINYWLIFDKDVVQTPEGFWISRELIEQFYDNDELKKPKLSSKFGAGFPSAYGRSMNSLRPIFDSIKDFNTNNIKIGEPFLINMKGIEADHIYIELESNEKIKNKYFEPWDFSKQSINISYLNDDQWYSYNIFYGNGHLLIPIGDDSRWLYENINEFLIIPSKGFSSDSSIKLKKFELLKLKRYR